MVFLLNQDYRFFEPIVHTLDKLMALADSGVTDSQELRRRTLKNVDFKPPH
jgi:hypothetical protein